MGLLPPAPGAHEKLMSAEERARALASVLSAITVRIRGLRRCSCSTTCRAVCCDRVGGGIIWADLAQ